MKCWSIRPWPPFDSAGMAAPGRREPLMTSLTVVGEDGGPLQGDVTKLDGRLLHLLAEALGQGAPHQYLADGNSGTSAQRCVWCSWKQRFSNVQPTSGMILTAENHYAFFFLKKSNKIQ